MRDVSVTVPFEYREKEDSHRGQSMIRVCLWGSARIFGADGRRIEVSSRKGLALLALLATAPDGERTRTWLQDRLWGSREREQAQQSLRRELTGLRKAFADQPDLLHATRDRIRLDTTAIALDYGERDAGDEFLEGFDLPGEEAFEDWLRDQRQARAPLAGRDHTGSRSPTSAAQATFPEDRSSRPGIVVFPLESPLGGDVQADLPESIADDLADRLARFRWLRVITPDVSMGSGVQRPGIGDVARKANATYAVQLRLVERDGATMLLCSLQDAIVGQLLWSENFPLSEGGQGLAIESTERLATEIESRIDNDQQARVLDLPLNQLDADQALVRARWHLARLSREDAEIARKLLAEELKQRPNSAGVLIQCAFAKAWDIWSGRGGEAEMLDMRSLALRAVASDSFDARGYMLAGMAEMWLRNHKQAETHFLQALKLNPSLAYAHAQIGSNYYLSGRPAEAIDPLRKSMQLSPLDNQIFYVLAELAVAHYMLGDYSAALEHAELSMARRPAYIFAHAMKVNALLGLGQEAAAREAVNRLLQAKPRFVPEDLEWQPFADRSWTERLKDGIERARAA